MARRAQSTKKPKKVLTDSERHKRFADMAKEVEASDKPRDFDKAFKSVTKPKRQERQ